MKKNYYLIIISLLFVISFSSCDDSDITIKRRNKEITNSHFNNEDFSYMISLCERQGININDLLIVIENESNYNYKALNPKSNAVGLIQLMPTTLSDFGLKTDDILNMTLIEQLSVIEKYYNMYSKYNLNTPEKLLLCTFYPYALRITNESYIFGSEVSKNRMYLIGEQNFIYDLNKDGLISLYEFNKYHQTHLLKNY